MTLIMKVSAILPYIIPVVVKTLVTIPWTEDSIEGNSEGVTLDWGHSPKRFYAQTVGTRGTHN